MNKRDEEIEKYIRKLKFRKIELNGKYIATKIKNRIDRFNIQLDKAKEKINIQIRTVENMMVKAKTNKKN